MTDVEAFGRGPMASTVHASTSFHPAECPYRGAMPNMNAVAAAISANTDSWTLRGFGGFKVVLAPDLSATHTEIGDAVVLVRRALLKEGQPAGETGRRAWELLGDRVAEVAALVPDGTVPPLLALPASEGLNRSIGRIMDGVELPLKPHHQRLPWSCVFGGTTLWATNDAHHLMSRSYSIEITPYAWWSVDLRRATRPELMVADGQYQSIPPTMPKKAVGVSISAGHHIPLDTRDVYLLNPAQMMAWLRSDQTESPHVIQRRAVTVRGDVHFKPTASQWAQSIRQIESRDVRILPLLAEELVRLLAVLREAQSAIPESGLDVHRLRAELAAGRGRDQLMAASLGDASVVVVALEQPDASWSVHGHFVDVQTWMSDEVEMWCRRVR